MTRSKASDDDEPPEEPSSSSGPPVVCIGASAGGLGALETLLPAIPPDSGLAYVVVQHLDPSRESKLTTLLARLAPIPAVEAADRMPVEANRLYVIPPNASLTMVEDRLHLAPFEEPRGQRMPIDAFLVSLAEARGESAAGVILSGTGSDGTLGLRAIKEGGGLTIAQESAEYDGMMRSAVASGMVDFVLPLERIPAKLVGYFRHLGDEQARRSETEAASDHLMQICALLRTRTGHDFTGYKDKTIARRVQRRMQVLQIDEVPQFIDRLRKDPRELDALLQDLLIGVTSFFRDPEAFAALEREVIPRLFEGKGANDAVRVWVAGCSTGEEAYSIAMLLRDHLPKSGNAPKLQVFASDIDEQALQIARTGRYPATIAKDVPRPRLERYFVREDGTYRIVSELREMCLFSLHDLLRDAPFSKLDLISCRNLLIYLTPALQSRVIPLFHYALNEAGFLFLGSSENVSRHTRLFSVVDKAQRIFRRRSVMERRLPEFPLSSTDSRRGGAGPLRRIAIEQESLQALAERQLLDRYAPAYVVVNADGDLLHGSSRTGKYLELAPGTPRIDIFSMARPGLRADLRAGLHKAAATAQPVVQRNVVVGTDGGRQTFDLTIHPLRMLPAQEPLYMVVFQDIGGIRTVEESQPSAEDLESASIRQLDAELRATRERLQTTTEELESSNEELKSGNEELSSMNEELQSANEELETSKEELQSINEELQTVNAELNARVEELSRANSDIANLLESTQIATVFLDRSLAVKSFTPAAKDVFRLVESDTGRPITHVRARFQADTVQEDAERVLRTLSSIEREVECTDTGTRYVMRMMPYRTIDDVIGGVVLTFVDVTRMTAAETRIQQLTRDLRDRVHSLETLLDMVPVGILIMPDIAQPDRVSINRHGALLLGDQAAGERDAGERRAPRQTDGAAVRLVQGERELAPGEQPLQVAARSGQAVANAEARLVRSDGQAIDVMITATPLFDEQGKARGAIAAIVDISERKSAEARQQVLLYELQHRVKNIIATISALATRTLRGEASMAEFSESFLGRLRGMAATHELLSQANWRGASLQALVRAALRPHGAADGGQVTIEGPDLLLAPNAAATLGMVFYELATNAAKYGALSTAHGKIAISWRIEPGDRPAAVLTWTESGGGAAGPVHQGFGTTFVKRSVEYELQGAAEMEPSPTGVRWTLKFAVPSSQQHP